MKRQSQNVAGYFLTVGKTLAEKIAENTVQFSTAHIQDSFVQEKTYEDGAKSTIK